MKKMSDKYKILSGYTKDLSSEDDKSIEEVQEAGEKTNIKPNRIFFEKEKKYKIYTDQFDEVIKAENLETKEELERLTEQAVFRQLVSDVEIGSYLSGGMDSGTLASFAVDKK